MLLVILLFSLIVGILFQISICILQLINLLLMQGYLVQELDLFGIQLLFETCVFLHILIFLHQQFSHFLLIPHLHINERLMKTLYLCVFRAQLI